jgi:hypothetical protein
MKRTAIWMLVIGLIAVMSCNKTDDPVGPSVVGTWRQTTYQIMGCVEESLNIPETPCLADDCLVYVFEADGTFEDYYSSATKIYGNYTISGSTLTAIYIFPSLDRDTVAYQYTLNSTSLTLTLGAFDGCKIVQKFTRQ